WRLLNIDDIAAPSLTRFAWGAAFMTWFAMLLNALSIAARTSAVTTVALDGLIALTYVALIATVLVTLKKQRQRHNAMAEEKAQNAESGHPVQRGGWLMLAWLGGHITVLAALIAALLGYLNFSVFVATQMVWITVVVLATTLLMKFADDFFTWLLSAESRSGRAIAQGTGIRAARVEQAGVLLSALVRVALLLGGLAALTAPFGNSSSLLSMGDSVAQGLTIGGTVLKPFAVVRAIVVAVIGWTIFSTLQHWLVETYLPRTELDIGARNSISTVARYVGITLAVLWTLAALGIGFEKLALVASALSVGIGFGLQAITQNFVSGLILLAERPVKIGDRVRIGDQVGDIRRISVRATEIQTDDKSTLIVPNSELITKSVQNLTMDGALGRISMAFSVPLSTDIVRLKSIVLGIYAAHEAVLENPVPAMYVDSLNGSVVNITSFGHVSSPRNVYGTRSDLLFELLKQTAEQGIALVSATDIHVIRDRAAPVAPAAEVQTKADPA
ncbi:MAG: mechanosensitive ion channel, partial [Comamonas sp.]